MATWHSYGRASPVSCTRYAKLAGEDGANIFNYYANLADTFPFERR